MIDNFDDVKRQLEQLSSIINSFKSEAVQLRLIDLIFTGTSHQTLEIDERAEDPEVTKTAQRASKRRKTTKKSKKAEDGTPQSKKAASRSSNGRPSGLTTLNKLVADGFFKTPKTIGQIVHHCEQNLALRYQQANFSGPLGRLTRDQVLTRKKNAENQYEYAKA